MKKWKKIKLQPSLQQILLVLLVLVIVMEGFALYYAFYSSVEAVPLEAMLEPQAPRSVRLNLVQYNKVKTWLEEKRAYQLAPYELRTATGTPEASIFSGRENPFTE